MLLEKNGRASFFQWCRSGEPLIWANAAAVSISVVAVIGLLSLLAVRGFGHFWPSDVLQAGYALPGKPVRQVVGEIVETEYVPVEQIRSSGLDIETDNPFIKRSLIKQGNRDVTGIDFSWVVDDFLDEPDYPDTLVAIERREWGNFYGFLSDVRESGTTVVDVKSVDVKSDEQALWSQFQQRITRALSIHEKIESIEKGEIGSINHALERLRLRMRGLELKPSMSEQQRQLETANIAEERAQLDQQYGVLQKSLAQLYNAINRDSFVMITSDGSTRELEIAKVVRAYRPNAMSLLQKMAAYFNKFGEFLTDDPREANTEGGIFPAIFGTVMMVLLMAIMVTPFGVIAAVYLREYAKQGLLTRITRIAVNNLAGVPSIVYGVFGLGFFIYFLGAHIDEVLFEESLPAPTFGTPGLLWASLTLALLTLPVVIVATEEGLARIPSSLREGSLALGATKAETLWRIVLPMASPAMMTGLILAVARAAGEVAPLMLVGVVKLAPTLPVNGHFPYLHLDQKFMHLGFHIYDVGFQSPNVEASRPLVYATALLLVVIIALLNFSAVALRNHLRERYKSLEM
jgi:phosphate transport system permease protein